jgi:DtxR family Mn-dependent transcriptional regulator
LAVLTTLFFMWGFLTCLNDIIIPHLKAVFELEEEGIVPLRARIAERLGQSGPTVSQTVARMERDGLLHVSGDRHLELSADGRNKAMRVMRKHRLAERLLVDVIGLEWEYVHDEACRWEHVMSERVERKLLQILDNPTESPYGTPIPGLEELGSTTPSEDFLDALGTLRPLTELAAEAGPEPVEVVVRRLGEPAQLDHGVLSLLLGSDRLEGRMSKWLATNWGSDIFYFGRMPGHAHQIRRVCEAIDLYSCECHRDVGLAREFGYKGPALPVLPNSGGIDVARVQLLRDVKPPSKRKMIMVKGYDHFVGRAMVSLSVLERFSDLLKDYVTILFSVGTRPRARAIRASRAEP